MKQRALVLVATLVLAGLARDGQAHYLGLTDSAIEIAEPGVRIVQTLPHAELAELDVDAAARASARPDGFREIVADGWRIAAGGVACQLADAAVREVPALDAAQFDLRFRCENTVALLEIDYVLAAAFAPAHVNLARVFIGGRELPWRFTRERRLLRLPLPTLLARSGGALPPAFRNDDPNAGIASAGSQPPIADERATAATPERASLAAIAAVYLPSGVEHILTGLDHVAFVLALVLVPLRLGRLVLAVTLFTLAHSVTLGLSYFELLSLSPGITEPLIALSVAAVGMENLVVHRRAAVLRVREATVFGFGLVHGIGLSYQLGALPPGSPWDGAARLALFNVGVELGQLAVLIFPGTVLAWAVRRRFGREVTAAGSAVLIGLGIFWFLARVGH